MSGFADGWRHGMPETVCGHGSKMESTKSIRVALPKWFKKYGVATLADAGAGDMNWIRQISLPAYIPYDVHAWKPEVIEWDIRKTPLPRADAILCRHVLNHFTVEDAVSAVNLLRGSCEYLIANTGKGKKSQAVGYFSDYELDLEPFNLGEPLERVEDCRGHLALWKC